MFGHVYLQVNVYLCFYVRAAAELETYLIAVERVREYSRIDTEVCQMTQKIFQRKIMVLCHISCTDMMQLVQHLGAPKTLLKHGHVTA